MKPGDCLTVDGLDLTVTGTPHPDATNRVACIDVHGQTRFYRWTDGRWVEQWPPTSGPWTEAHAIARRSVTDVIGEAA